jgi:transposase
MPGCPSVACAAGSSEELPLYTAARTSITASQDPYAEYVLERWQAGVHDGRQLFEEIKQQGFPGSIRVVHSFLQTLREKRRPLTDLAPAHPSEHFSARKAVWLFLREPSTFSAKEDAELARIRQASATLEMAYGLVQDFLTMVHKRQGDQLEGWIQRVQASQIPELRRFALGLLKDQAAVEAGLTLIYSNGPVEAQVQKRETSSNVRCSVARNFLCSDNAYSMQPDIP